MSTLTITRGLPGSGKTTYAKQWVSDDSEHRSRLNRDDFREMLHGGAHDYARYLENAVTHAHHGAVKTLLLAGRDVICDDMNLQNKQVKVWMELAKEAGADFAVVDFTNVSVGDCIERDFQRGQAGGREVGGEYIAKKWIQFIKGRKYPLPLPELAARQYVEPYVAPEGKPKAILVDIDGTMALMNGRGPFDWHRVGEDLPNEKIINLVSWIEEWGSIKDGDYSDCEPEIIFMSGRDEVCRAETELWLSNQGFSSGPRHLFMRPSLPDGVQQPADNIVKLALFDEHIRHNYDVQFVLDDRPSVIRMWCKLGLTVLDVDPASGEF